ncbi:hypothetical protein EVAR_22126_1 [Eumeta japonica]|uniref:Uncharacterized protein n=1 Tax=Eumeta variegata TaxID=151549 RepID=A0A4C1W110_EUMVA|nr:hypothetical protein EVAR_22126_1 [Eumeta japonica]
MYVIGLALAIKLSVVRRRAVGDTARVTRPYSASLRKLTEHTLNLNWMITIKKVTSISIHYPPKYSKLEQQQSYQEGRWARPVHRVNVDIKLRRKQADGTPALAARQRSVPAR